MQPKDSDLTELNRLMDRAAEHAGSDTKLASMLKTTRQRISDWRAGRKTCQPEDQALMAEIAGLDAMEVLARATVAQFEGTPKGDLLMRALGKGLLATGAALGSAGASAAEISSWVASHVSDLIRCILVLSPKQDAPR